MFLSSALNYFAYMDGILFGDMPSVLVKVLGAYTVSLDTRGQRQSYHFVVMENVFYGRRIQHIYDLKVRRRVQWARCGLARRAFPTWPGAPRGLDLRG